MSKAQYTKLVKKLTAMLDKIERLSNDEEDRLIILDNAWEIGKEADTYARQSGTTIQDMALDIGTTPTTLQKFARFYRLYKKGYKKEIQGKPVNWSHYTAVLYIGDKKARDFYIAEAALYRWSSHELRRRIRNNYYENRAVSGDSVTRGSGVLTKKKQRLYTYGARVVKVVDGDTLELDIDVGFKTKMRHKVRLRGINCPEAKTKKGEKAKRFVMEELFGKSPSHQVTGHQRVTGDGCQVTKYPVVIVKTYKSGKFGRYIVDVWYLKGETDQEVILAKGKFLNQVLLDNKLAVKIE